MIPKNCLSAAVERWHRDGGYLVLRRSAHWGIPHVMHVDAAGNVSNYVPPDKLKHPLQALTGFDGVTLAADNASTPPVPLRGIVIGAWLLALGGTAWALRAYWRRLWRSS